MHKSAVPASEKRMKAELRSTRHASSIHATLSNHPIEAFFLSPSCINKVIYAIGQPGRKALFCSQNCAAEYTGNRRRLRNEVAELNREPPASGEEPSFTGCVGRREWLEQHGQRCWFRCRGEASRVDGR